METDKKGTDHVQFRKFVVCPLLHSQDFYDSIAKEKFDKFTSEIEPQAAIKLKNIYFITIDVFDQIAALVAYNKSSVTSIILNAIENDSNASSKKFEFSQHLSSFSREFRKPKYLEDETDFVLGGIKDSLR